jgi:hypothetical protein
MKITRKIITLKPKKVSVDEFKEITEDYTH